MIVYDDLDVLCPYCKKLMKYAAYTAFTCMRCKKGFSVRFIEHPSRNL